MALLPDKNPAQSATIWGNAIKALGAVLAVVGAVFVKEASWGDVLKTLMEYGGVLMALVGWIIASIGQRKAIGASIVASQEALAATNKVLDNQADVKIALGKKK
jgi:protein-S-isoprenylcysteine O-methyltransferase Ste14